MSALLVDPATLPVNHIPSPKKGDCYDYYFRYINLVPANTAGKVMVDQVKELQSLFGGLSEADSLVLTPPYTWSLRQVLGHLGDGERVFGYRAARLAAGDTTPLPGFDQDVLVAGMNYHAVPIPTLLAEWLHLRLTNIMLFSHLQPEQYLRRGTVDGKPMNVSAAAGVIPGHVEHHLTIIRKRLGKH